MPRYVLYCLRWGYLELPGAPRARWSFDQAVAHRFITRTEAAIAAAPWNLAGDLEIRPVES